MLGHRGEPDVLAASPAAFGDHLGEAEIKHKPERKPHQIHLVKMSKAAERGDTAPERQQEGGSGARRGAVSCRGHPGGSGRGGSCSSSSGNVQCGRGRGSFPHPRLCLNTSRGAGRDQALSRVTLPHDSPCGAAAVAPQRTDEPVEAPVVTPSLRPRLMGPMSARATAPGTLARWYAPRHPLSWLQESRRRSGGACPPGLDPGLGAAGWAGTSARPASSAGLRSYEPLGWRWGNILPFFPNKDLVPSCVRLAPCNVLGQTLRKQ